jgi:hypothetical protein
MPGLTDGSDFLRHPEAKKAVRVAAKAAAEGFRHLGYKDDHAAEWIVYDALYAYCREMVKRDKPHGDFMS